MPDYPETTHPYGNLTQQIIGIAIKIHKEIGPGFREKYYQRAMYLEFQKTNLKFEREKKIRIPYGNVTLGYHIIDFIVEDKVVVEIKSMKKE
jgi:GxxExxY protein